MNDADRKAFDMWWDYGKGNHGEQLDAWQAACEWSDSQVREPIGWRVAFTKAPRGTFQEGKPDNQTVEYWRRQGIEFEYCYAAPPTAQINQQLVELLEKAAVLLDQMMVLDQVDPQSAPEPVSAVDNDAWYLIGDIKAALAAVKKEQTK